MDNFESDGPLGQRKKPRYQLALRAELWYRDLQHHVVEKTANISLTGLFLCTEIDLPKGDTVHVRIIFKDLDAYFDAKAKVIWRCDGIGTHPMGLGLQFFDVSDAQSAVIERYLKNYVNVRER
ncbi:MAG TPA: PilZ domain-containing protein [Bdellovibrionota bacterium]|nr:PilZ domain-containing protein [Bdellovibrionota bacterium]